MSYSRLVCHATPTSSDPDFSLMQRLSGRELTREYAASGARIVAFGHWHEPFISAHGGMTLLNLSSVSIPFDSQPLAAYTLAQWHERFWRFRQYRVGYDLSREVRRIQERAMPRPPWPRI